MGCAYRMCSWSVEKSLLYAKINPFSDNTFLLVDLVG